MGGWILFKLPESDSCGGHHGRGFAIVQDTEYSKSFQVGLLYDVLEISKPINRQVGPGGHINRHDD